MLSGQNSMVPLNRSHEVMLWGSCRGKWWTCGLWSRAPWKSSLESSQHLEDEQWVQEVPPGFVANRSTTLQ